MNVLEVLKNLLGIKGCVFVLAIDFNVVEQGIKKRYQGMDPKEASLRARLFFEKIIQVPFTLPVSQYPINEYVRNEVNEQRPYANNEENERFTNSACELIEHLLGHVGSRPAARRSANNPRLIKRAFNQYALYHALLSVPSDFETEDAKGATDNIAKKASDANEGPASEGQPASSFRNWDYDAELDLFAMQLIQMSDESLAGEGSMRYEKLVGEMCSFSDETDANEVVELFHDVFDVPSAFNDNNNGIETKPDAESANDADSNTENQGDRVLETLGIAKSKDGSSKVASRTRTLVTVAKALGVYTRSTIGILYYRLASRYPEILDALKRHLLLEDTDATSGQSGILCFCDSKHTVRCEISFTPGDEDGSRDDRFDFSFSGLTRDHEEYLDEHCKKHHTYIRRITAAPNNEVHFEVLLYDSNQLTKSQVRDIADAFNEVLSKEVL